MRGELRLQLMQASSAFTLTDNHATGDFAEALSHGADVVSFTEIAKRHDQLKVVCLDRGYELVLSDPGDVAMAVRRIHKLLGHGQVASVPAVHGPARLGGHNARPVLWAAFQPFGTTEHVTAHSAHWVTRKADTGHQQLQLTEDMAAVVKGHSRGSRLGFWMGDTNNNDQRSTVTAVDRALRKGELTSCWDELGRWPSTHDGPTLDVIGSYDPDRRVSCARARVWPAGFSDHRPVSAWYVIRPPKGL